jgi:hypothetical protein
MLSSASAIGLGNGLLCLISAWSRSGMLKDTCYDKYIASAREPA